MTLHLLHAALFNRAPSLGDIRPAGEIDYQGYKRVPVIGTDGELLGVTTFPKVEQDDPVWATHVVVLDGAERVVGVKELGGPA